MVRPGLEDIRTDGKNAVIEFERTQTGPNSSTWCNAGEEQVRSVMNATGYPAQKTNLIPGRVEETPPITASTSPLKKAPSQTAQ